MMITDHYGTVARGDLGVATTPGTGCGVVLGNVAPETTAACERVGVAVAHAYGTRYFRPDNLATSG
jgi:hypothetical protein